MEAVKPTGDAYNMKKNLKTKFQRRQYMLSRDFEIYYYSDSHMENVDFHIHDYYEFYFLWRETSPCQ